MSAKTGVSTCGCCSGIHVETPLLVANRPGLSAIAYRAGDWGSFKRSMLAALSGRTPISALTSRDDDDFSIALLDAFATTADVLTFYQERIANESYLRTAGERASVLQLARLIDYELAPGVASNVWLTFNVDTAEGSPPSVRVDKGTRVQSVPGQDEKPQNFETSADLNARAEWNELKPRLAYPHAPAAGDTFTWLKGTSTNLSVGDALLFFKDNTHWDLRLVDSVTPVFADDKKNEKTKVTWVDGLSSLAAGATIFAMRVKTAFFGYNAQSPNALPADTRTNYASEIDGDEWKYDQFDGILFLDGNDPRIKRDTHVVLQRFFASPDHYTAFYVKEFALTAFAMSGKSTLLILDGIPSLDAYSGGVVYRSTVVYTASEALEPADHPVVAGAQMSEPIELDGALTQSFEAGRPVIIRGKKLGTNTIIPELAYVKSVADANTAHPKLTLTTALANHFDVTTVSIFGNVAAATNGETVTEVLGSGDAATPFQRFKLAQSPMTYTSSDEAAGGAASTLEVYVNDVKWTEVPTLFNAGPNARVYTTRRDDEAKTTVYFGDGKSSGARLPTGDHNIRAVYRKGIGSTGNVDASKISLLLTKPLGLKDVSNTFAAEGGADGEILADARTNAPRTVLTLDRVVSLLDYQAYAASFAGIAKAIATWTWTGTARQVFLTVAAPKGTPFPTPSTTLDSLAGALVKHGDPYVPLTILDYKPAPFVLVARVGIEKNYVASIVLDQVRKAVAAAFAFEARSFGEAVDLSDVIKVMHSIAGVASVDIDFLFRVTPWVPSRQERLTAKLPRQLPDGTLRPAEILTLAAALITEAK